MLLMAHNLMLYQDHGHVTIGKTRRIFSMLAKMIKCENKNDQLMPDGEVKECDIFLVHFLCIFLISYRMFIILPRNMMKGTVKIGPLS